MTFREIDPVDFDPDLLKPQSFVETHIDGEIRGYSHPDYGGMLLTQGDARRVLDEGPGEYMIEKGYVRDTYQTVRFLQAYDGQLNFVHDLVGFHGATRLYSVGSGWCTWDRV